MFIFKGDTPMMSAVRGEHLDIVEFLVTHGADVNVNDGLGEFVIFYFIV